MREWVTYNKLRGGVAMQTVRSISNFQRPLSSRWNKTALHWPTQGAVLFCLEDGGLGTRKFDVFLTVWCGDNSQFKVCLSFLSILIYIHTHNGGESRMVSMLDRMCGLNSWMYYFPQGGHHLQKI